MNLILYGIYDDVLLRADGIKYLEGGEKLDGNKLSSSFVNLHRLSRCRRCLFAIKLDIIEKSCEHHPNYHHHHLKVDVDFKTINKQQRRAIAVMNS
jgi:hypothetical protein